MDSTEVSVLDPETEFLASKQETGHEWELFKENVRPLKRGRNVNLLNHALKSQTDFQLKKSLLDHRRLTIFPFLSSIFFFFLGVKLSFIVEALF